MSQTTLAGHPLHPQLIAFPAGLLPTSCVLDLLYAATGDRSYADAAYYTLVGGYAGGLAAGAAGAADYFTIPPDSESKKVANVHAGLNIGVMGLYTLNLLTRATDRRPGPLSVLLSLLGTAGLVVSQWYGGDLVYKLGMRVKPAMKGDQPPEWKLPGDEKVQHAMEEFQDRLVGAE
jgi:uncharacterized membrane protein